MLIPLTSTTLLLDKDSYELQFLYVHQSGCKPCRPVGEMLDKFSKDSHYAIYEIETGAAKGEILTLLMQLRLEAAPTIYAFCGGKKIDLICGGITIRQFRAWVRELEAV